MADIQWAISGTVTGLANNQQGNAIAEKLAKMIPGGSAPTTASTGLTTLSGLWWHDTSNNQVKVRDQADTTWIVIGTIDETAKTFIAAATGIAAIQGAAKNLKVSTVTGSAVVTADEVVLETTGNVYGVVRSVSVTISPAASGANGLDTGTIAANTWYSVWVIYNGATTAGLISTSATAPTMPSGYTYKARVGWVRTNATPALYPTLQYGRRAQYVVDGSVLTALRSIGTGSTSNAWISKSVSTLVPTTAAAIRAVVAGNANVDHCVGLAPNSHYSVDGSTAYQNPAPLVGAFQSSQGGSVMGDITLESTSVYYLSTASATAAYCLGWEDSL